MRVELGQKGDYAIRAALDLARADGERRRSRDVAAEMAIPEGYLPHILGRLVAAGLVDSVPGRNGGYVLARPAEDISLLEIIEAVEGPMVRDRCVLRGGPCHWDHACAVHPAWSRAQDALIDQLRGSSLRDIASEDERLASVEGSSS